MFLAGSDVDEWVAFMLDQAGPHANRFETLHAHIRGGAGLAVTSDTGGNRFRSWEDEVTLWHLARIDDDWHIVGYFVRDLANPE
jgi:hypothetical protein